MHLLSGDIHLDFVSRLEIFMFLFPLIFHLLRKLTRDLVVNLLLAQNLLHQLNEDVFVVNLRFPFFMVHLDVELD